jgi:hypothetical protein
MELFDKDAKAEKTTEISIYRYIDFGFQQTSLNQKDVVNDDEIICMKDYPHFQGQLLETFLCYKKTRRNKL